MLAFPATMDRDSKPYKTIIIADDEPILLDIIKDTMRQMFPDAAVIALEDGAAALHFAKSMPHDLLITDNQMPRIDGMDLIVRLRKEGYRTPIILASGDPGEDFCRQHDVHYLAKPFATPDLARIARGCLYK
jgi:CheY-like chemotaxis protein